MYFDEYVDDTFISVIAFVLPLFMIISYIVPVCRMISLVVSEKEYKNKEIMMIMGLSSKAYWLSWLTYYSSIYTIIAALATIITSLGGMFAYSNGGYIFLLFLLFGLSSMAFSFFISVFFSRARSAVMVGLMIYLVSYFLVFAVDDPKVPESEKLAASLMPPMAFSLGITTLATLEAGQVGVIQ